MAVVAVDVRCREQSGSWIQRPSGLLLALFGSAAVSSSSPECAAKRTSRPLWFDEPRISELPPLRPLHLGRHRRQNRLDIAAGLQAEDGAAVVQQVEFHIASAPDQLFLAVFRAPRHIEIAP